MKKVGFTLPQEKILFFLFLKRGKNFREIEEKKNLTTTNEQKNTYFSGTNICTFSLSICVPK